MSSQLGAVFLGGANLVLGAAFSLSSRGATLSESGLPHAAHSTSSLTRISTAFNNTLKIPSGPVTLCVAIATTFMGTLKLSFYIIDRTRYNKNSVAIVGAFALASVAALGAYWVGMPNVTKLQGG